MATNKHATIRYHALDRCFSNFRRNFFIENLIVACNEAICEFSGIVDGVKKRQVFDDIRFMESEQGWSVPLEHLKDGKQVYYRYSDRTYSIKKQVVNESEAKQLKETLSILTRFKGMPQFEWMEEMLIRIESAFNLKGNNRVIVGFEQNPYLKGLNHFTEIFNAIQYKEVLKIEYKGFKQNRSVEIILHPYFLKQYNSRWFLFGYNEAVNALSNLALDRIINLEADNNKYLLNEAVNFDEYFEDVLGVTVSENNLPVKIHLEIVEILWPYIESKPIHGSQRIISKKQDSVIIELDVQINYELITTIFAFGEGVKVLQPEEVRMGIKHKAEALLNNYL